MAVQLDPNGKDDLKTQFVCQEGTYRLLTLSEYTTRPNRVGYQNNHNSPQVRVSLVTLPPPPPGQTQSLQLHQPQQQATQQQQNSTLAGGVIPTSNTTLSSTSSNYGLDPSNTQNGGDRICFNFGKELYVYAYRGVKKVIQQLLFVFSTTYLNNYYL